MTVYVAYKVSVLVEVDLDAEEIIGGYVDDERVDGPSDVIVAAAGGRSADEPPERLRSPKPTVGFSGSSGPEFASKAPSARSAVHTRIEFLDVRVDGQ